MRGGSLFRGKRCRAEWYVRGREAGAFSCGGSAPGLLRGFRRDSRPFGNRIAGLTGSAAQIAAVAKAYRVYYAKHPEGSDYSMDHTAILYVMRPNGTMAGFMTPDTATPAMVQRLKELMAKG